MSRKPSALPPIEIAKTYFRYDQDSGLLYRIKESIRSNGWKHGQGLNKPVSAKTEYGYLRTRITHDKKSYEFLVHRMAWFLYTGKEPVNQIDHINGTRDDNRLSNLREVTNRENQCNRHKKVGKDQDLPIGVYRTVRKGRTGIWYGSKLWFQNIKKSTYSRSLDDAIKKRKQWESQFFHSKAI